MLIQRQKYFILYVKNYHENSFYPYNQVFSSDKENYIQIFSNVCSKGFYMQSELENFEKYCQIF